MIESLVPFEDMDDLFHMVFEVVANLWIFVIDWKLTFPMPNG
jgi:hypothetical protein